MSCDSVKPGQHNITIQRRADYELCLNFKESDLAPIDLTDWTLYAQIWDKARTVKYADFSVVYVDRALGETKLVLTDTQSATLPDEAFYDVLLESPSGKREYYLEGNVYASEGYTQPAQP
jgi:hypothetical protein